jgi:sterol desaturase/sphingolipid hydroxylase (fatty acid hydroxylase superfamily)
MRLSMAMRALVKQPRPATCRQFETPLIEYFSRIHPATPFLFWVPFLSIITVWALSNGLHPALYPLLAVPGWLIWSLTEYLLHRFVFHALGPRPWQRRFHFVFHGVHHDFPQDSRRLVMPLGVSIPIGFAYFYGMIAAVGLLHAVPMFVGFGIGYLSYDGIHYFTHHLPARSRLGKFLKRYHLVHHHAGVEGKWGVSTPLWDYVFRTTVEWTRRPAPSPSVPR